MSLRTGGGEGFAGAAARPLSFRHWLLPSPLYPLVPFASGPSRQAGDHWQATSAPGQDPFQVGLSDRC